VKKVVKKTKVIRLDRSEPFDKSGGPDRRSNG